MSWEANTWATKQRMKLPQEQLVLIMLGNCADPDAIAFSTWPGRDHWWKYLAEITRLSRSSLFRHINTIVALGLATRSMIVLADGSKRPTIKLNLNASFNIKREEERYLAVTQRGKSDESHSETHDENSAEEAENDSENNEVEADNHDSQNESHGETDSPLSPTGGNERVPPVGLHIDSNIDSNLSPLPPASGGSSATNADRDWDEFVASWGEPMQHMALTRTIWDRIATDKRPTAIAAAKGFWNYQRAQTRPKTAQSAKTFLRDQVGWAQWLRYVSSADGAPVKIAHAYPVDSPEGRAIIALHEIAGLASALKGWMIRNGHVSYRRPVTPQLLALGRDMPDRGEWPVLTRQQAAAWEGFLRETVTIETRHHAREGGRAPWPWPPGKDGTIYAATTDPPSASPMRDEDFEHFR